MVETHQQMRMTQWAVCRAGETGMVSCGNIQHSLEHQEGFLEEVIPELCLRG